MAVPQSESLEGLAKSTETFSGAFMSERDNTLDLLTECLAAILRPIVRQAVEEALNHQTDGDRLLDTEEAAELLAVSEDWLYRHAKKLPFARKVGPKMLRFSALGIQKYLMTR
jgi:predicted DNA-binding transcriptional regulator AlpA